MKRWIFMKVMDIYVFCCNCTCMQKEEVWRVNLRIFFGCTGCSGFVLSYHVLNCENPVRSFFLASFQNSNVSIIPYHIFSNRCAYFIHRFIINIEILLLKMRSKTKKKERKSLVAGCEKYEREEICTWEKWG